MRQGVYFAAFLICVLFTSMSVYAFSLNEIILGGEGIGGEVRSSSQECGPGDELIGCDTGLEGVCGIGTRSCGVKGRWSINCIANTVPSQEIYDGLDNDCDGSIDEGCENSASGGVCSDQNEGSANGDCSEGQTRTCSVSALGACSSGDQDCENGNWGECAPANPSEEVCGDRLDNDCDGSIDEGCGEDNLDDGIGSAASDCSEGSWRPCGILSANVQGSCTLGVQTCENGNWGECAPANPSEEVCGDRLDNDCDGSIDEGCGEDNLDDGIGSAASDCSEGSWRPCGILSANVQGSCTLGVQTCENGNWGECAPANPSEEVCGDRLDNDCDGSIDEGCGEDNLGEDYSTGQSQQTEEDESTISSSEEYYTSPSEGSSEKDVEGLCKVQEFKLLKLGNWKESSGGKDLIYIHDTEDRKIYLSIKTEACEGVRFYFVLFDDDPFVRDKVMDDLSILIEGRETTLILNLPEEDILKSFAKEILEGKFYELLVRLEYDLEDGTIEYSRTPNTALYSV